MMRYFALLISLWLAGCSNPPYRGREVVGADEFVIDSYKIREGKFSILEMEGKPLLSLNDEDLKEYKDVIQNGDVLKVALFHPTRGDLVQAVEHIGERIGYRVSEGKILLPDLSPIEVEGLTLEEAREKIEKKYVEEIRDIEVFLAYKERTLRKVELAGLVSTPQVPVDGKLRLFEVLANARVPVDANLFRSYFVREDQLLPVDMYKLLKEGDMSQNVVMRGGDKIYIASPEATNCMVLGEVTRQGIIPMPNGSMSLRETIAQAGGILFTGDKRYIQVVRGNIARPKIYSLNWQHVVRLPTDSLLVMPGDIVYVAATPIAEWNRFISQLFPTFTAIELFTKGVSGVVAIQ